LSYICFIPMQIKNGTFESLVLGPKLFTAEVSISPKYYWDRSVPWAKVCLGPNWVWDQSALRPKWVWPHVCIINRGYIKKTQFIFDLCTTLSAKCYHFLLLCLTKKVKKGWKTRIEQF
jgi:hypothetical protein